MGRRGVGGVLLAAALTAGCGGPPAEAPPDTGARAAAEAFFEALLRKDWSAAYDLLDPTGRARVGPEAFARRAAAYRSGLGFEPREVRARSCEEHGADAVAHVVFNGPGASGTRFYRDAVTLRRDGGRWAVVPPAWAVRGR
jgi:hypothetical protein